LLTEFKDVDLLHGFDADLATALSLDLDTFTLILSQVQDVVLGNISYPGTVAVGGNTTDDVLNLVGDVGGFAGLLPEVGSGVTSILNTTIGLTELLTDDSNEIANSADGVGLAQQEQEQVAFSNIAGARLNQFNNSLTALGKTIERIESDWGRLQVAAKPLVDNEIVFNDRVNASILQSYELSVRRSLYTQIMPTNYVAVHYRQTDPGLNYKSYGLRPGWQSATNCYAWVGLPNLVQDNPGVYGFWPGALIDGPGATVLDSAFPGRIGNLYPFDQWWDLWFVGNKDFYQYWFVDTGQGPELRPGCPTDHPGRFLAPASLFADSGLFAPTGPGSNGLGFYKPWFLARGTMMRWRAVSPYQPEFNFWSDFGNGHVRSSTYNWAPDPDNY
jgi:hypothetical protein